jgi:hypothetical protein
LSRIAARRKRLDSRRSIAEEAKQKAEEERKRKEEQDTKNTEDAEGKVETKRQWGKWSGKELRVEW